MKLFPFLLMFFIIMSACQSNRIENTGVTSGENGLLAGKPISTYLNDKSIPQPYKDLFLGVRKTSDDRETLSLLDSVLIAKSENHLFYFLTVTRTMKDADGAYSEPLGAMTKIFVEHRTTEFIHYFQRERIFTMQDMEEWSQQVAGEIKSSSEGSEDKALENLAEKMKVGCNTCSEEDMKLTDMFIDRVKSYVHPMN